MENLDIKIGQMIMIGFRGTEISDDSGIKKDIINFHIGGVWIVDNENPMGESIGNISSPEQLKKLTSDLQTTSDIPMLISVDAEGGRVIRLKEIYGFPNTYSAKVIGEKNDLDITYRESLNIAELLRQSGINLNLAPVVDLYLNPDNPALGGKERCYSKDPHDVLSHARKVIEALHSKGIACCLKHFPGHGSSSEDTHLDFVDVSNSWMEEELVPYKDLIKEGMADAVLTAHIFNKRFDSVYPATLSYKTITKLLRNKLGFDGVVISDDILMGAIRNNYKYEDAIVFAINAGVDIILQSNVLQYTENSAQEIFSIIKKAVTKGNIKEKRIEESFRRIMKLKRRMNDEWISP